MLSSEQGPNGEPGMALSIGTVIAFSTLMLGWDQRREVAEVLPVTQI